MAGYKYRQHGISPAIQPYREYNTDLWEVVPKITLYKKTISHLLRQVAYLSHRAATLEAENQRLRGAVVAVEAEAVQLEFRSERMFETSQSMVGNPGYDSYDIARYGAYSSEAGRAATVIRTALEAR